MSVSQCIFRGQQKINFSLVGKSKFLWKYDETFKAIKYRKYFWLSKEENCTLSMDIEAAPHKPLERSLVFLVVLLWHLRLLACPPLFLFPYTKGEKGKAESSFATEEQWQRQQSHRNWRQKLFCYWRPLLPKKSQRRSKVISERMPTKLIVEYHNFFPDVCLLASQSVFDVPAHQESSSLTA